MIKALNAMKDFRNEILDAREEVLFEKKQYLKEQALKETTRNSEAVGLIIVANKFYKESFSLFNEAKSLVCSNEEQYDEKAELLDHSQLLVGIANDLVAAYIEEEMPAHFKKTNERGVLGIKGLLQLMNQGKFNAVDSLIKTFTPHINVNEDFVNSIFEVVKDLNLNNKGSVEAFYNDLSITLNKDFSTENTDSLLTENKSTELAEKEEPVDFIGFDLEEPAEIDEPVEIVDFNLWVKEHKSTELAEKEEDFVGALFEKEDTFIGFDLEEKPIYSSKKTISQDSCEEYNLELYGVAEKEECNMDDDILSLDLDDLKEYPQYCDMSLTF